MQDRVPRSTRTDRCPEGSSSPFVKPAKAEANRLPQNAGASPVSVRCRQNAGASPIFVQGCAVTAPCGKPGDYIVTH
ncbi:hypothetical protein Bbelb_411650, partial [Branchiostoma belcheri]